MPAGGAGCVGTAVASKKKRKGADDVAIAFEQADIDSDKKVIMIWCGFLSKSDSRSAWRSILNF